MASVNEAEFLDALCRESFDAFLQKAFTIAEPAIPYEWNWHIGCMSEHLDALYKGEIMRLMFLIPPRTLKSFTCSSAFPAWVIGKKPQTKFIDTGYGLQVVEANARKVKQIITSQWYENCFPEMRISPLLDRLTHFETTKGGQYYAATALSPVTGIGCFVAGTMISTNKGLIPIEQLRLTNNSNILALSYDHETGKQVYAEITDWCAKTSAEILEVRTHGGRVVRCTPDHRFYTVIRGYQRADSLQENERLYLSDPGELLAVPKGSYSPPGGYAQEGSTWPKRLLLLSQLFKKSPRSEECGILHNLRQENAKSSRQTVLRKGLSAKLQEIIGQIVCAVRESIQAKLISFTMLFSDMRKSPALYSHDWGFKLECQSEGAEGYIGSSFGTGDHSLSRWIRMFYMWGSNEASSNKEPSKDESSGSSYRREPKQQRAGKLNNSLRQLPYNPPQIQTDTVSSITRISDSAHEVYDITVKGTHNYYANGILVHNCDYLILDDLIKPMEALSDQIRNSVNLNLRMTLLNRFNDRRTGKVLLVQQRIHEDDPAGNLMRDGGYTVVKLPAEAKRPVSISLRGKTWSMETGELLFPARLSREALDQIRIDMLEYNYVGQYLQEPAPIGGGEFRQEWIQYYAPGGCKPKEMNIVILVDPAGGEELNKKKKKLSDWTAFMVVGLAPDNNYYLLDIIRDRLNPTDRVNTLFMLHRKWNEMTGKSPKVGYERYGMMTDIHYIKKKQQTDAYNFPLIELGGPMAKEERIRRLIPDFQNQRWYFPQNLIYVDGEGRRFDLVSELVKSEMPTFPRARFDDMLDALSRIMEPELGMFFPKQKIGTVAKARKTAARGDQVDSWESW